MSSIHHRLTGNELVTILIVVSLVILFTLWINNPWRKKRNTLKNNAKTASDNSTKVALNHFNLNNILWGLSWNSSINKKIKASG